MEIKSATALQNAHVTGFSSSYTTSIIYGGSLSWLLFLLACELFALLGDVWNNNTDILFISSIAFNITTFVVQTVDFVFLHFSFWPVTAVNWCSHLAAIGTATALVSSSLDVLVIGPSEFDLKRNMSVVHLVSQCLFTASQFAVTLEYFERRLRQLSHPVLPTVHGRSTGVVRRPTIARG